MRFTITATLASLLASFAFSTLAAPAPGSNKLGSSLTRRQSCGGFCNTTPDCGTAAGCICVWSESLKIGRCHG
ncbi:hypothetical protein Moror_14985 [Moniliophthora roreri MCA 2997]|uniref:Uncharacterized protein n=1 Tax=Moniliophthora roreri (strain MCA 2997) TaxID=1381753 RepID=V2W8N1_MONRO|nr:hypothetical protein Moror_14985 [Moniliophthora roreri MCA 2997]